jgi:hypothetical protein
MRPLADVLTEKISAVRGVIAKKSRFSARRAFYVGTREFLHFHGPREVDVRLTRKEIRARKGLFAADARVSMRGTSDWIEVRFEDDEDVDFVISLARIAMGANRGGG